MQGRKSIFCVAHPALHSNTTVEIIVQIEKSVIVVAAVTSLLISLNGCANYANTLQSERLTPPQQSDDTPLKSATDPLESQLATTLSIESEAIENGVLSEESVRTIAVESGVELVAEQTIPFVSPDKYPLLAQPTPQLTQSLPVIKPPLVADLWTRLRSGYALPANDTQHSRTQREARWYAKHQNYLDRTFKRGQPYFHYIVSAVEERGMPLEIALLPVVESAFQPFAYSHGRASGIWQFIPGTARRFGLKIDWWYDGRRDIQRATTAALDYLQYLNRHFDGNWLHALAAYNSGEGTVRRAIRRNEEKGLPTDFWNLNLPRETRGYVPKLLAIADVVGNPQQYAITLNSIPDEPYLTEVNIGSQIDLAMAADMAVMPLEELYRLNPGFNRWATSPDGPHQLLLPSKKAAVFTQKLATLPADQRIKWVRHRIKKGETLSHIAKHYRTTVATVQRINKVQSHMIRTGKHLLIPVASRSAASYALSADQRLMRIQNTPKGGKKISYTVRKGDTIWDISRAHKVSMRQLAAWNGMAPHDYLQPGQKLVIWSNTKKSISSHSIGQPPVLTALTRKINYKVRRGDSLARISQRFNVTINKLKRWNPNARGKYLQPGQRLVLYVDVTNLAETAS